MEDTQSPQLYDLVFPPGTPKSILVDIVNKLAKHIKDRAKPKSRISQALSSLFGLDAAMTSIKDFVDTLPRAEVDSIFKKPGLRFITLPSANKENIKDALVTDGDNPVIKA